MSEDRGKYETIGDLIKSIKKNKKELTTLNYKIEAIISLYREEVIANNLLEKRVRRLEQLRENI
ncbi:MAG TPA: hypothetical protein ENN27_00045 [Candidatus Atribacteria bacterium]|nr:hypothetical protein [Candidatus Atribacteria bacterium]